MEQFSNFVVTFCECESPGGSSDVQITTRYNSKMLGERAIIRQLNVKEVVCKT